MRHAMSAVLTALAAAAHCAAPRPAEAQDDAGGFYAGKTVRFVVGIGVGSGYDINARNVARHIGRHIPGSPQIVVQNQPGAGSLTMANQLYGAGPKDGTAIGVSFQGLPSMPLLAPDSARFDSNRINWIGSTNREVQITYSWHAAPIRSIEDIRTKTFVVGSQAPGSSMHDFPVALNTMFGFKFQVINGYESSPKIQLAMERGEVMGLATINWSSLTATAPHWIADKKINIFGLFAGVPPAGQRGARIPAELADVPRWLDIAKTEADRQALQLLFSRLDTGRPFFLPPDVPPARVEALRRAFDATMKDQAFLEDEARAKLEVDPMTGEEMAALIAELYRTPPDVIARVRASLELK